MTNTVFLNSDVNDFVAPSVSCVNPVFNGGSGSNDVRSSNDGDKPTSRGHVSVRLRKRQSNVVTARTDSQTISTFSTVEPVLDTKGIGRNSATFAAYATNQKQTKASIVTASLADCLVCSGCVTSAETVLLEQQHSIQSFRDRASNVATVIATLSPAAGADLLRMIAPNKTHCHIIDCQLRLTSLLHSVLGASIVIDGNLLLSKSLQETAEEVVIGYNKRFHKNCVDTSQSTAVTNTVWSSSCPAVVALAETTHHKVVPLLVNTRSALGMSQHYIRNSTNNHNDNILHVGIMPCHDKKLEVSRAEYNGEIVDVVLTTNDVWQLITEKHLTDAGSFVDLYTQFMSLPLAGFVDSTSCIDAVSSLLNKGFDWSAVWVSSSLRTLSEESLGYDSGQGSYDIMSSIARVSNTTDISFLVSGGYADYCFRYACQKLFNHKIDIDKPLNWQPIEPKIVRQSRRVAKAQRQRTLYQVCLYKDNDGYTTHSNGSNPILRVGLAHGLQAMQQVWPTIANDHVQFDFVEAMACPGGCINGGGQVSKRATAIHTNDATRKSDILETPVEVAERLSETRNHFVPYHTIKVHSLSSGNTSGSTDEAELSAPIFKAILPLQHARGAVAGVAVKDTQW